jgi:outer membrane PBP1 activator LpoA protein
LSARTAGWRSIFAGCGTHTPDQSTAYLQGTAQADSSYYLQQMQQSTNDSKTNWQLLAIRALKEGKKPQASTCSTSCLISTPRKAAKGRCWRLK